MKRLRTLSILATVLFTLGGVVTVQAQTVPGENLLSAAEQKAFHERLSNTYSTSERAKIRAEMNRLIQQRKLEQRRKAHQN